MPELLVEELSVTTVQVEMKFTQPLKVSSITGDKFQVINQTLSTPAAVNNPFKTIDRAEDYNSISRILTLYWNSSKLDPETTYHLKLTGLEDPVGSAYPDEIYEFTTESSVTPTDDEVPAEPQPVIIEDHSVKSNVFTDAETITATNPTFYIEETDPEAGDFYLPEDHNSGRVTVKFSTHPSSEYISTNYFRVQRKPMSMAPSRWETIDVNLSTHPSQPWVYIDFPSNDATPEYNTAGKTYFEENYKYRIKILGEVST